MDSKEKDEEKKSKKGLILIILAGILLLLGSFTGGLLLGNNSKLKTEKNEFALNDVNNKNLSMHDDFSKELALLEAEYEKLQKENLELREKLLNQQELNEQEKKELQNLIAEKEKEILAVKEKYRQIAEKAEKLDSKIFEKIAKNELYETAILNTNESISSFESNDLITDNLNYDSSDDSNHNLTENLNDDPNNNLSDYLNADVSKEILSNEEIFIFQNENIDSVTEVDNDSGEYSLSTNIISNEVDSNLYSSSENQREKNENLKTSIENQNVDDENLKFSKNENQNDYENLSVFEKNNINEEKSSTITENTKQNDDNLALINQTSREEYKTEKNNYKKNKEPETRIINNNGEDTSFISLNTDTEKKDLEMLSKQISKNEINNELFEEDEDSSLEEFNEKKIDEINEIEEFLINSNEDYKNIIDEINKEIEIGKQLLSDGNFEEAMSHFDNADSLVNEFVLNNSDVTENYASLQETLIASSILETINNNESEKNNQLLLDQIEKFSTEAIENNNENSDSYYILSQKMDITKDYQKEIEELMHAIENDGDNYLYYFQLGKSQYRINLYENAEKNFNRSCELKNDFYPARFDLGLSQKKLNNIDAAENSFEFTLKLHPNHKKSLFELAQIDILNEKYSDAEEKYKTILKYDENNTQAMLLLGTLSKIQNNLSNAEDYFVKALKLLKDKEDIVQTEYNLSTVLYSELKFMEAEIYAREAYQKSKSLNNFEQEFIEDIIYNYAFILEENNKIEDSIDIYSEVLKLNPNHEKTKNNLAVMMMKLDPPDIDNALTLVYSIYKKNKKNFEALNNLATILNSMGEYDKAVSFYLEALEIYPESQIVINNLAKTYVELKDYEKAKSILKNSLVLNDSNYQAYIELAKISFIQGDDISARNYLIQLQKKNSFYSIDKIQSILESFEK